MTVGDMEQPTRRTADFVYHFVAVDYALAIGKRKLKTHLLAVSAFFRGLLFRRYINSCIHSSTYVNKMPVAFDIDQLFT